MNWGTSLFLLSAFFFMLFLWRGMAFLERRYLTTGYDEYRGIPVRLYEKTLAPFSGAYVWNWEKVINMDVKCYDCPLRSLVLKHELGHIRDHKEGAILHS